MVDFNLEIPFDQFARYRDLRWVIELVYNQQEFRSQRLNILDVGGYFVPIEGPPYLPGQSFFADMQLATVDTVSTTTPLKNYLLADGNHLPFAPESFDWVNASDVIEHVSPEQRSTFLKEMIRCSRNYISISAPVGTPAVELAEEFVLAYIERVLGLEHKPLQEHRASGLPSVAEMEALLTDLDPGLEWEILPSGNLYRWIFMMISRHLAISIAPNEGVNPQLDRLYNSFLYQSDHSEPTYRNIYIISKAKPLRDLKNRFQQALNITAEEPNHMEPFLMDLLSRIEDQERWALMNQMRDELQAAQNRLIQLTREKAEAQAESKYFQRELLALSGIWPVKLWRGLKKFSWKS
ncbi:class I SAM-dependent methyltransferase [candidate division CSSED10-310 bacterium]|uniref:Class I SAM-dependent methyltransferase n=1 Tax=candidate division CSSED10-310 bacterium TaxID=2855610 RepID=A0ABV6Z1N4_UNCC1